MAANRYKLRYKINGNNDVWQEMGIDKAITVGRNPDCEIILSGAKVSRKHVVIQVKENRVFLQDLGSSNGTFINGQKVSPLIDIVLQPGTTFSVGDVAFQLIDAGEILQSGGSPGASAADAVQSILWYRIEHGEWKQVAFTSSIDIGRGDECGLTLDEGHVSRVHCTVSYQNGMYTICDLGSHNGTFMEGNRLEANIPRKVYPGQYFNVGRVSMTIASAVQQTEYRKSIEDMRVSSVSNIVPIQQQNTPARHVAQAPQKRAIWPWFVGIGGVLMVCICGSVVGLLVLLNQKTAPILLDNVLTTDTFLTEVASLEENTQNVDEAATATDQPETNEVETPIPVTEPETKWLVMLYEDADDEVLEYDMVFDVNEAEYIGSSPEVKIVTQLDRNTAAYDGDGNWSESRRYELTKDTNLEKINSPVLESLGEVDSGDVQTLVDFVIWAINTYPAEHYVLILSDHGGGWFGGYTDGDNGNTDGIYLPALESALAYMVEQTGIGRFDIFGFDACLMAQLEVWSVVAPYAEIGIASEETESATGWAYGAFLEKLVNNPAMSPNELAGIIVDTFVEDDMLYQTAGEDPSYAMSSSTLSAIDLGQIGNITSSLNNLSTALQYVDQSAIAEARTYSMSYVLFSDYNAFFLDLVNFGQMVCSYTGDGDVCSAADGLTQAVSSSIIAEKHGSYMDGSNGITFYFPDSSFFEITVDGSYGFAYRQHAGVFATQSLWDEFLDFHYLGRSMP